MSSIFAIKRYSCHQKTSSSKDILVVKKYSHHQKTFSSSLKVMADYESNFDTESESEAQRKHQKRKDLMQNESTSSKRSKATRQEFIDEYSKEEGRKRRHHFLSLNAYSRHKILINEYILCHPGSTSKLIRDTSRDKTEYDLLRENHRFLWGDDEEADSFGKRIAKKYYDKLFKEYCIADLTRFKENKIAMRWRTENEVIQGKGQFICGERKCSQSQQLKSWEVNFAYHEDGCKKNALVKLRLCDDCSLKLNYRHQRKLAKIKSTSSKSRADEKQDISERKNSSKSSSKKNPIHCNDDANVDATNVDAANVDANTSDANDVWTAPSLIPVVEKSIDDEFDDYLNDLFV